MSVHVRQTGGFPCPIQTHPFAINESKVVVLITFEARTMINLLQNQTLSCHLEGIWEQIAFSYRICSSVLINLGYEAFGFGPCFLKSELPQSFESISVSAAEGPQGLSLLHLVAVGEPWRWCTAQGPPQDTAFLLTPRPQFLPPHPSVDTMSHSGRDDELSFSSLVSTVDHILDTWWFYSLHRSRGPGNHNWSPVFVTLCHTWANWSLVKKQPKSLACEVNIKDHCVLESSTGGHEHEGEQGSRAAFIQTHQVCAALCAHNELCSASKTRYQIHVNPIG